MRNISFVSIFFDFASLNFHCKIKRQCEIGDILILLLLVYLNRFLYNLLTLQRKASQILFFFWWLVFRMDWYPRFLPSWPVCVYFLVSLFNLLGLIYVVCFSLLWLLLFLMPMLSCHWSLGIKLLPETSWQKASSNKVIFLVLEVLLGLYLHVLSQKSKCIST